MANNKIGLLLNKEQAEMILRGLNNLSAQDKANIIYDTLTKELGTIVTIWDRRIKNEKILLSKKPANLLYPSLSQKPVPQKPMKSS